VQAYVDALRPALKERRFQVRTDDKPQLWARLQAVLAEREQRWALTGADAAAPGRHSPDESFFARSPWEPQSRRHSREPRGHPKRVEERSSPAQAARPPAISRAERFQVV